MKLLKITREFFERKAILPKKTIVVEQGLVVLALAVNQVAVVVVAAAADGAA